MSAPATPPIRVLLVDDEPLARRGLRQLLAPYADAIVVGECRDGREALAALDALAPQLVFLDVQMPELDGFGVVRARGAARMPATIFLTAYEQFAVPAFEVEALDYLVKPVAEARFATAMQRARRRLLAVPNALPNGMPNGTSHALPNGVPNASPDAPPNGLPHAAPSAPRRLVVPGARGRIVLTVDEIDWIGADDYYAAVYAGGRRHLLRESLASLAARLDPARFLRVHRAAVVNVERVRRIHTAGGETSVVLHDGTRLPVSRRRRAALDDAIRALGRPAEG